MMWLIPRSDPGALTEYRRPHAGGVSTTSGRRLPYGPYPRLIMLWMYAECAHALDVPPQQRDPVASISDFLLALGIRSEEVIPVFEEAERLFACRFHVGGETMPVTEPWVLESARAGVHPCHGASARGKALAYGDAFARELTGRRLKPCPRVVRALRHCAFALDVYLWDLCHRSCARPGASPAPSRLARYRALAEPPLRPLDVKHLLDFERDLAWVREQRRRLETRAASTHGKRPAD